MTRMGPPSSGSPSPSPSSSSPSSAPAPSERRFERRIDGPRRVKNGLKLASRDASPARNDLAQRWLAAIESHVPEEARQQGLEYAHSGQIVSLQILAGAIEAMVQGTAPKPYRTRIIVPALDDASWQRMIEAMAGEAMHAAKVLAGELPPNLHEVFAAQGFALTPATAQVTSTCTCAAGGACKHVAAAANLLAEQLSDQPLLVFALLGLPAERLLERLRQARTLHTRGVAMAHGETAIPGSQAPAAPLESQIEDFWRGTGDIDAIAWQPPPLAVRHALLRRLGPSPLAGKFPMVGLLASIYDTVTEAAKRQDEEREPPPPPEAPLP